MEALRKALVVGAMLGVGAGVGSALFVLVTPGEERIQAMLKVGAVWSLSWDGRPGGELRAWNPTRTTNLSSPPQEMPGQDPRGREETARNKQLVLATLQEAAATQENVVWRKNWMAAGSS
uniref:Ubiquinol-cytochrome-c reductase complex assembly factor 3 n=1 Tax=Rhinolophus ferrumequinum TaxID=59479 RepID=A0A671F0W4_RHIFE